MSLDLLCIATLDGRLLRTSPSWQRILGFAIDELEGRSYLDFVHPDDIAATRQAMRTLGAGTDVIDFTNRYRTRDGAYRWIEWRSTVSHDGLIYAAARDITQRIEVEHQYRQAEDALRSSENQFRSIVESSPTAMYFYHLDAQGQLILTGANPSADRIIGMPHQALLGKTMEEAFPQLRETAIPGMYRKVALGELPAQTFEVSYADARFSGVYDVHVFRTGPGVIAVDFVDVTDRKRQDEAVRRAKEAAEAANRAKDQFIAVLSHELRTPLTPAMIELDLLLKEPTLPQEIQHRLLMIRRNIDLESKLIEDLLDISRIVRGEMKLQRGTTNVHTAIRGALATCRPQILDKQHKIALSLMATHPFICGDPDRLQQLFWNLIGNAVKYTPANGHIRVATRNADELRLRIEIEDDGIGIEPEAQQRIFQPFVQGEQTLNRRFGGLGLGLSISKAIIESHGGTISVRSPGKGLGSCFTLELPKVDDITSTPPVAAPPPEAARTRARILLVEDSPDTAAALQRLLQYGGHEVHTADNVANALNHASDWDFDLLLCDIGLPDGTGWELLQKLSAGRPVPAVALSGFATQQDLDKSREAGFRQHLTKPIRPDELLARIDEVLQQRALA
jgi:PAS domain S-box-containing protein